MARQVTMIRLSEDARDRARAIMEARSDWGPGERATLSSTLAWLVDLGLREHDRMAARRTRRGAR